MAVCLLLSAYFSATETAFSSASTTRLKTLAEKGNANAALACRLLEQYDRLLSTILIGNNIVNIATASIGTVLFVRHYGDAGATISTVVVTVVVLIFGEISPKSIAKDCAERFAMFSAPILRVLIWVLLPLNLLFSLWKKLLAKAFRLNGESKMSQEELLMLVDEVQQGGSIDKSEGELLRNAIGCGVTGKPIAELLSPTLFAPENEPISLLLKKMQQGKTHVAVVVDEYGGTCGIVTMEDILEELVGEIWDEHEQEEIPIRETAEHAYLVDAGMDFDDFADFFHLKTDSEMVSVSGWVMERCGGVPESGDRFTYDDLDVLVVKVDHHRIEELRVTQRPHAGEKAETALIGEMAHE